jgi:type IV pilus assembly protein PilO
MALIPQEPKQQKALIAIVVALGLFYAFWAYWRTPKNEELVLQQERLERLESQNGAARVRALQKERLEQQAAVYERYVRRLEQLVPAQEEVPALLRDIQTEARRLNVDVDLVEPLPDQPGAFYTLQGYTMRVFGEYHDVGRFLTAVASLPRIITPVDVAIEPFDNTELLSYDAGIIVDFEIETYVLPAGRPAPVTPGAEAGGGE